MPVSWKMGDSIGSGSFGNVYLGLNNDTGKAAAVPPDCKRAVRTASTQLRVPFLSLTLAALH